MSRYVLIGIGAGLASAFLLVSTAAGGLLSRIVVYLLAPLPLVLAGLSAGALTALIASVVSVAVLFVAVGGKIATLHILAHVIPTVVLCHFAALSRDAGQTADAGPPRHEWFPVGSLVAIASVFAGIYGLLSTTILGVDGEQQRELMRRLVDMFAKSLPRQDGKQLSEAEINQLVELGVLTMPAAAAFSWLLSMLLNFYLGARITAVAGHLPRPMPDIPSMTFPVGFGLSLAAALPMAFMGGKIGLAGSAFAGALFCAHLLMGLAIVHDLSRGVSARPAILAVLYVALVILNSWVALGLVIFAVLAPVLPLRRPGPPAPPGPAGTG